ncbi:Oligosaccharide translocation protein rft1 [Neolecta irregularis DAH-3]|uniref:Man(5)GlcNAc(2)-PP-dolichol translocation protein RFT1 n=1 Tax=Neolecta irregularis (strain DAH-3) TaxID=1198029 RepID=A0A1U7LII4_NEOID|nr:Oligosaccharide translocation protein rft1 [Neolecta irregularis DAH-3]|eukprot:OLL22454.1 Oligosaccharide translocation protein rft1 [Neolecta irregularis DAH-3]
MGVQLLARAVSLCCTALVLRRTPADVYGFVAGRLELLAALVLALSRDPLRGALQRFALPCIQPAINTAWLAPLLGAPLALAAALALACTAPAPALPLLLPALALFLAGLLLQLATEPLYAVLHAQLLYPLRARAETAALLPRALLPLALHFLPSLSRSPLPFAAADLAAALLSFLVLYLHLHSSSARRQYCFVSFSPLSPSAQSSPSFPYPHSPSLALAKPLLAQTVVKLFLTQGDRLIFSFIASPQDQGAFAVASNYGSILARLFLAPIEDSSKDFFAKSLPTNSKNARKQAKFLLKTVLRIYFYMSCILFAFAIPYLPLFVQFLGKNWSKQLVPILHYYIFYLSIMAYNGIAEAFVSSVADRHVLKSQNRLFVACSCISAASGWILVKYFHLGARGLVLMNAISLSIRFVWSARFVIKYFEADVNELMDSQDSIDSSDSDPSDSSSLLNIWDLKLLTIFSIFCGTLARSFSTKWSAGEIGDLKFLVLGIALGLVYIILGALFEKRFLLSLYQFRPKVKSNNSDLNHPLPIILTMPPPSRISLSRLNINLLAGLHTSRISRIAPVQPQIIQGTVNDATPIPPPNKAHGSYHWTFERLISVALVPLIAAPFAAGSVYPVVDAILASTLVIHSHSGFDSMLTDYIPKRIYPKTAKTAGILLKTATGLVLLGLYEFETNDVGITEMIRRVWQA